MNDYTKGILTGASLILCFFMLVSAKSQSKNLGDVTVTKLQVVDGRGNPAIGLGALKNGGNLAIFNSAGRITATIGGGFLRTYSAGGEQTSTLGTRDGFGGELTTSNGDGKQTSFLGTGINGVGALSIHNSDGVITGYFGGAGNLKTYNKHEVMTGYFGTDSNEDGIIGLHDRYGDAGWGASGKK